MTRPMICPEMLASCPVCGCLVLAYPFPGIAGETAVWDPGQLGRRFVRAYLGPGDVARQGFGLVWEGWHECPPPEDCALDPVWRKVWSGWERVEPGGEESP